MPSTPDLIVQHFADFIRELGVPVERFLELGAFARRAAACST